MKCKTSIMLSALALGIIVFSFSGYCQVSDPSLLTLERIFSGNEFSSEYFGPAKWIDNGNGYTTLESSPSHPGFRDIVRYESASDEQEILVSAAALIPQGQAQPLQISNYSWSPDKSRLLIYTNTARVWRQNTRGDYWVLNLADKSLTKLGGKDARPSTLMFAKFSPDNQYVGYVREHNIFVEKLSTGKITQLTFDGSTDIINGTFDWVYEEEFGIRDGFRWSPDSRSIAFWQLDAGGIRDFYMINNTDSIYSFLIPVQYPKVGMDNSACKVGVVGIDAGAITWMQVPGDPRDNYIARMDWANNATELIIQRLNRKQNQNQVMLCNSKSGEVTTIYTDKNDAWVDVVNDLYWLSNGKKFTWVSEKDGWRHVYTISRDGKDVKSITPWEMDIISIQSIHEASGWLYFIASPENGTQRYLYRSRLNGKGQPVRLSPADMPGTHSYQLSPDTKWAFHTYSNANTPPKISLVNLPKHKHISTKAGNASLIEKVSELKRHDVEFFEVEVEDGVKLDGFMLKPYNFDPSKKYPVLFYVYGEPAGQTVLDRWGWSNYLWHTMLTQQGYIIISLDNRGTPSPKGSAWRKVVYGSLGVMSSQDQANGLKAIMKQHDFVDPDRIGIWGWSGGGSMTLNMLFRYPDLYKTGMSVAPVSNQLLYDNIYQERYMGLPWENKEGYKNGSPVTYAKNLKGNLLLVHGTGDDNVHYQNTEVLINELVKHNKIFSLMSYPNRSHGIYERPNTSRHLREILTHYLKNNLPAGPK
ncbi:S9 family peptidase [Fulvivirgaceae bacterium BMA12]|uniref:S9 family peptidase n=1 Tax=Agaribacillus aureus TaxID=3051825 RepID=A0ABT8LK41_9BACT|nr:S9 family peptidase [Fulvivirgaceae bacterium BMA12]